MNETMASMMSLLRSVLITIGGILTEKGWAKQSDIELYVGAVMIIAPALWGIWDKFQSSREKQQAVNAGITFSNSMAVQTPLVESPAEAQAVIKEFASQK